MVEEIVGSTNDIVSTMLLPALFLLLTWVAKWLTAFIKAKMGEVQERTSNETLKKYLGLITESATNIVYSLNQTMVEELKSKSADGKLTKEEAEQIKEIAVKLLISTLKEDALEFLTNTFDDAEEFLASLIEKIVVDAKK